MKERIIGYAIDANTVELTGEGLSAMFESLIELRGREAFEDMMTAAGWIKVQSSDTTTKEEL